MNWLSRFPDKKSIVNVFATSAFIVYGWTIISSFWKIPSWMYYLKTSEIIAAYAYSFLMNFLESSLLTLSLIFLGFILSGILWKGYFSAASVVVLIVSVGSALLHMHLYEDPNLRADFLDSQLRWWLTTFFIAFVVSTICVRVPWLRKILDILADRFVVFLYIYIPLTLFSLVIALARTVF
jgi:hypothetical protein